MSKKKKTGFINDLWVIVLVDQMDWDVGHQVIAGPVDREKAFAEFDSLTDGGTKKVGPKDTVYYQLRQHS